MAPVVLVIGRQAGEWPPGLPEPLSGATYRFAEDIDEVRVGLPGADVVFHYGEPHDALRRLWPEATEVRWVHVGGVGVDWSLFPELVASDVLLTNSRGVFDVTMPEYVLALMLALVKDLPATLAAQREEAWRHRLLSPLAGGRAVIVGAGSIGRATARLLDAVGVRVTLLGRRARAGDDGGTQVRAIDELADVLPSADWLLVIVPLTPETRGLIGERALRRLPTGARVVNVGRGPVIDEEALVRALRSGHLAGAALDVFETEPLPPGHALWSMPGVIVSPHIGGDVTDTPAAFTRAFLANLERYRSGRPLLDVVDKRLGYAPSGQATP